MARNESSTELLSRQGVSINFETQGGSTVSQGGDYQSSPTLFPENLSVAGIDGNRFDTATAQLEREGVSKSVAQAYVAALVDGGIVPSTENMIVKTDSGIELSNQAFSYVNFYRKSVSQLGKRESTESPSQRLIIE